MTLLITLTVADIDTGPFNLYSNVNGFTEPFAELIEKSVLLAGYTSTVVPDNTTIIRVQSVNELCNNSILLTVDATTSTTTSTSTSTSTTTITTTINTSCSTCSVPEVTIGTQIWKGCNLDISTYSDGTEIPQVTDPTTWNSLTTGAWCYYNDDPANCITYGRMYNWYAVAGIHDTASFNDPLLRKKLAPTGFHIPTDAEWTTLTTYLGGESVAGGKMKSTGNTTIGDGLWQSPNAQATNSSVFTGLPGGFCDYVGVFSTININGFWWSSTEYNSNSIYAWYRNLYYNNDNVARNYNGKVNGFSVRCIKD